MNITTITVSAGRGFNHPYQSYANFKFDLHLTATLNDEEDPDDALAALQRKAEGAAEAHKNNILKDIERKREIANVAQEIDYEKRKQFDTEASKALIASLEEKLTQLTSAPLLLE